MKIFVAFGYRPEDAWVKTLVIPMIRAFADSQELTGEKLWGLGLTDQIAQLINDCDAVIAFMTKRDAAGNTHPWVLQEAGAARQAHKRVLEVWETGLAVQPAMNADTQRIAYDPAKREECIAELARALIEWHNTTTVQPYLVPAEVLAEIRNLGAVQCQAVILNGARRRPPVAVELIDDIGGTFIILENVRRGDMVQLLVSGVGGRYRSPFTPINNLRLTMEKIP